MFDKATEKVVGNTKAHKKSINSAVWINESSFATGSDDHTVKIWSLEEAKNGYKIKAGFTLSGHTASVQAVAAHPSKSFLASAGLDSVWSLADVEQGEPIYTVTHPQVTTGYTAAQFHPDGLLFGAGTEDGVIRIFDVKSQANVANFEGHQGSIKSLFFSENGYHLASVSALDDHVKFWDLRKLSNLHNLQVREGLGRVRIDASGKYVGVTAGADLW